MQSSLADQLDVPAPLVECSAARTDVPAVLNPSIMQTVTPTCFAHVARNPFEMVVSAYLYDTAGAEHYASISFGRAAEECLGGCMEFGEWQNGRMTKDDMQSLQLRWSRYTTAHVDSTPCLCCGAAQVFNSSVAYRGRARNPTRLPRAKASETYAGYLKRVDLDAGLVASFIFSSNYSLAPMRFVNDLIKSQHCSIQMCFEDFYSNCTSTWQRLMRAWEIPQPQRDAMLHAATRSCPGVDPKAVLHSSDAHMEEKKTPTRARALDGATLEGVGSRRP